MNNDGYRINGGIGFSITAPLIICQFKESDIIEIIDERILKLDETEKTKLLQVLYNAQKEYFLKKSIKIVITGNGLPHYGLGSNTAIYLSSIEALMLINNKRYDSKTIKRLSTRGGTSGIGINTYFEGGFVLDIGIKNNNESLKPSSIAIRNGLLPLVIHNCKSPDWKIGICIPKFIKNKSEKEEIDFFESNCPINKSSVEKILYESLFGITSAIIENDYSVFCKSINEIQSMQWKKLERTQYNSKLENLERTIFDLGADCVGMSSLGPTLFFLSENIENIILNLSKIYPETICYFSSLNNQGRIISYD
jgi:beta-ribofuranosylaminobenzene 5'-phosphate synthase